VRRLRLLARNTQTPIYVAVDIDDTQNGQLTTEEWKFIEQLVGSHVVRTNRWATEDDAEALWNDIKKVNDLFVETVAAEIKHIEKSRLEREERKKEV
jgi:hypothetical protein